LVIGGYAYQYYPNFQVYQNLKSKSMTQSSLRTLIIFPFLFLMGFSLMAQHSKTCGTDHMTDLIKQQFPENGLFLV